MLRSLNDSFLIQNESVKKLKFQTICIQKEILHTHNNKTLIISPRFLATIHNVDVGVVEIFDKNKEGKRVRKQLEVDFVVNQGNQRYYIQVAYDMTSEEKQTQEFNSLRNIPDSFKKIVIVNGSHGSAARYKQCSP